MQCHLVSESSFFAADAQIKDHLRICGSLIYPFKISTPDRLDQTAWVFKWLILSFYQQYKNFTRAMHTHYQSFFNIAGSAWTCNKM